MSAVCIKPACGPDCCGCNSTISTAEAWQYVRRYAYLRSRDLDTIKNGGVFAGMTPQNIVLSEETLDAAIDAAMEASALQADRDINTGKDSGRFEARRDAAAMNQQIQRQGVIGGVL